MLLQIEGLPVIFPYDFVYPEQYAYMCSLKKILDANGQGLLEMPSGTGKTVALLSLLLAYQTELAPHRRIVYCSRTVPEIDKALAELKKLVAYRKQAIQEYNRSITTSETPAATLLKSMSVLGLGLSARKNLCIHPQISTLGTGIEVDSGCHSLTAPHVRYSAIKEQAPGIDLCPYFEGLESWPENSAFLPLDSVLTFEELKEYGRKYNLCPYFLVRYMLTECQVIIYSYHYMLDPRVSAMVSRELDGGSIVIFDEAHNMDNVCLESMSLDITLATVKNAARGLNALERRIREVEFKDRQKLDEEYQKLLQGIRQEDDGGKEDKRSNNSKTSAKRKKLSSIEYLPLKPITRDHLQPLSTTNNSEGQQQDVAMPGSIRKAIHFVMFMRRLVEYCRKQVLRLKHVYSASPQAFLNELKQATGIDRRPLKMCTDRFQSLLQTLEVTGLDQLAGLARLVSFATLLGTYTVDDNSALKGISSSSSLASYYMVLFEPRDEVNADVERLHMLCLDPTLAINPVLTKFKSVIITSGTLSPLDMYPRILGMNPALSLSLPNTMLTMQSVLPLIVTRDQTGTTTLSSRFELRNDPSVARAYGQLCLDLATITPDGLVIFFPSYLFMHQIVNKWSEQGTLDQLNELKLVFIETADGRETGRIVEAYRRACDTGRGACLLSVARGKVSEGVDFENHYGRAVAMLGIPYQYTESRILKARLEYLRDRFGIREADYLTFDAMRHAAQCLGRVFRTKLDYGAMILADKRFARSDKRAKLPPWLRSMLPSGTEQGIASDLAIQILKKWLIAIGRNSLEMEYLREEERREMIGKIIWTAEVAEQKGPQLVHSLILQQQRGVNVDAEMRDDSKMEEGAIDDIDDIEQVTMQKNFNSSIANTMSIVEDADEDLTIE